MIESKKNNLHLTIQNTSLVGDCAVSVCFKANLNACYLNNLKGSCSCDCFPEGAEESCLCYSIFLLIQNTLCGSPLAITKSKVGSVNCGYHDNMFMVTWRVKGTKSSVRKSLGMALKCLVPGKLYSTYVKCIKNSSGKVSKESFNYVADEMCKSIKESVKCCVIGNISLKDKPAGKSSDGTSTKAQSAQSMIDDMVNILSKKIGESSVKGSKEKPSNHNPCDHSQKTEINTSGWGSYVVKDYIEAKIKGVSVIPCDKYLLINMKEAQWETASKKIKKYVKDYVHSKYKGVKSDLPAIMGYLMICGATVCCSSIVSLLKNGADGSEIEKILNNAL